MRKFCCLLAVLLLLGLLSFTAETSAAEPAVPKNLVRASDGKFRPAPGYAWVTQDPKDLRVRWVAGSKHPTQPNVLAGPKEGTWHPAPGFKWLNNIPGDLRVVEAVRTLKSPAQLIEGEAPTVLFLAHPTTTLRGVTQLTSKGAGTSLALRYRFDYADEEIFQRRDSMVLDFHFRDGRFVGLAVVKDTAPIGAFQAVQTVGELLLLRGSGKLLGKHPTLKKLLPGFLTRELSVKRLCEQYLQLQQG